MSDNAIDTEEQGAKSAEIQAFQHALYSLLNADSPIKRRDWGKTVAELFDAQRIKVIALEEAARRLGEGWVSVEEWKWNDDEFVLIALSPAYLAANIYDEPVDRVLQSWAKRNAHNVTHLYCIPAPPEVRQVSIKTDESLPPGTAEFGDAHGNTKARMENLT